MKNIKNNLRACRKAKGLSQFQVMQYLGLKSMDRISRWESGLAYPSVVNFIKLLELYDVTPREMYPVEENININ